MSDKEVLADFLEGVISDGEQARLDREEAVEKLKQRARDLLIGKTITNLNFHEHGDLLSIEIDGVELKPTSDDSDYSNFCWLEIWTE